MLTHRSDGVGSSILGQVSGVEYDRAGVAAHAKNLANKVKGGLEVRVPYATGEKVFFFLLFHF